MIYIDDKLYNYLNLNRGVSFIYILLSKDNIEFPFTIKNKVIYFYSEGNWYENHFDDYSVFENIYGRDSLFELRIERREKIIDKREMKLKIILNDI